MYFVLDAAGGKCCIVPHDAAVRAKPLEVSRNRGRLVKAASYQPAFVAITFKLIGTPRSCMSLVSLNMPKRSTRST